MTELLSQRAADSSEPDGWFGIRTRFTTDQYLVELSGELDMAGRAAAFDACVATDHLDVVVDLSGLSFMDCSGYGALVASTKIVERRGGALVLRNPVGEPQHLLELIGVREPGTPLRRPLAAIRSVSAPGGGQR